MEWTVSEVLTAQAIGRAAMDGLDREAIAKAVDSTAVELLEEIREILNDGRLDDSKCFHRIDAIISAFDRQGVAVIRHDFG